MSCGVIFAKLRPLDEAPPRFRTPAAPPGDVDEDELSWPRYLVHVALEVPEKVDPAHFYGRAAVFVVFAAWTLAFLRHPPASPELSDTFIHGVSLIFHEAGHVLMMPFGWDFLTSLGGTLWQILIPAICMGTLLLKTRDPFGASIGLWWVGQNFLDVAPYIADARALKLMLLGGPADEVEGHDWEAILTYLGWMQYDVTLGRLSHLIGLVFMFGAHAWGAYILYRQRERLEHTP